jgi:DNA-binding transcriptional LysR family regulator
LTETGRIYRDACKKAIEMIDEADATVVERSVKATGVLRITAPVEIGASVLAPGLSEFLSNFPAVQVELILNDRVVDLIDENFDVAIRIGTLADSTLISRALVPFRLTTCASPEYLRFHGTPSTPADLAFHECLDYAFHNHPSPFNWVFQGAGGEITVQPKARMLVNDGHALVAAALAGGGIIRASALAVSEHVEGGKLVPLLTSYRSPDRPMHVVYPPQKFKLPKLRVFVDWLTNTQLVKTTV